MREHVRVAVERGEVAQDLLVVEVRDGARLLDGAATQLAVRAARTSRREQDQDAPRAHVHFSPGPAPRKLHREGGAAWAPYRGGAGGAPARPGMDPVGCIGRSGGRALQKPLASRFRCWGNQVFPKGGAT